MSRGYSKRAIEIGLSCKIVGEKEGEKKQELGDVWMICLVLRKRKGINVGIVWESQNIEEMPD